MNWGYVNLLVAIVVATLWAMNDKEGLPGKNGKIIRFILGLGFGLIPVINCFILFFEIESAVKNH